MKYIISILLVTISIGLSAQSKKNSKKEEAFLKQVELVNSNQFEIEVDYAYPSTMGSRSLASNPGYIIIRDSVAEGHLPFFGKAYSIDMSTPDVGINFDNKIKSREIKQHIKKKKKYITYQFVVSNHFDSFDIMINIYGNDKVHVSVTSNKKSAISYSGKITPVKKKR